jgi:hypothetical protein
MNVNGSPDLHPHFIEQSERFKELFDLNISVPLLCTYCVVSVVNCLFNNAARLQMLFVLSSE